jgi:hypothetical protein
MKPCSNQLLRAFLRAFHGLQPIKVPLQRCIENLRRCGRDKLWNAKPLPTIYPWRENCCNIFGCLRRQMLRVNDFRYSQLKVSSWFPSKAGNILRL